MHVSDAYVCGISGQNSYKRESVRNLRKSKFSKKGKTVISVETENSLDLG